MKGHLSGYPIDGDHRGVQRVDGTEMIVYWDEDDEWLRQDPK